MQMRKKIQKPARSVRPIRAKNAKRREIMIPSSKKMFRFLALILVIAVTLFGCTGQHNQSSTPTSGQENPSGAAASQPDTTLPTVGPTAEPTTETSPSQPAAEPVDVKILALKGPTAMGMVDFMNRAEEGGISSNRYSFTVAAAPDEALAAIVKGEVNIAAVPANMAAALYQKTQGQIRVLGINTLGVLYICGSNEEIKTMQDLSGKTIYASGKGATPEYVLTFLLEKSGVADAVVEWKSEHAECVAALANDPNALAMLPQPFVSVAMTKNPNIKSLLDLTEQWDRIPESGGRLITGVVVVRKEFAEAHPQAVEDFMMHYAQSVETVNTNTEEVGRLVEKYNIVPAKIANAAIPKCNIVLISGNTMKAQLEKYLEILHGMNPKAVGGKLPDAEFYYMTETEYR